MAFAAFCSVELIRHSTFDTTLRCVRCLEESPGLYCIMHVFTSLLGCLFVARCAVASPHALFPGPPLAFAGGFGGTSGSGSSTSNKANKAKRSKRKGGIAEIAPVASKESKAKQNDEPQLDRWGLPVPTSDDIFPPMPPGTELIAAIKDDYSLQEVKDALKDRILLRLDRFDESGVEKNVPTDRAPMKLRLLHQSPPVLAIDNYFSPEQCLEVQEVAVPPSSTNQQQQQQQEAVQVNSATFSPLALSKRTSTSWFCHYAQVPTLLAKTVHMLGIPLEQMEEPQIVRYKTGQEFSWHLDEVPAPQLANGGQRVATLLVYLNTVLPVSGGGTVFRDLKDRDGQPLTMRPVQGSALLFFPAFADGRPDDRTLHKGEVALDEKWIIQMWTHERPYQAAVPRGNSQQAALQVCNQVSLDLGYL
jgi:prolyl 4-hydroxylase